MSLTRGQLIGTHSLVHPSAPAVWLTLLCVVVFACGSPQPLPSPSHTPAPTPTPAASAQATPGPTSSHTAEPTVTPKPTPPPKAPGDLALEACDPDGQIACQHQAVFLSEPIAAAGVALTYSSEWADGRLDRPVWNAASLGLGGWSLDVLHRYDPANGVLLNGDGSWRLVQPTTFPTGEQAIPNIDGTQYYLFDTTWRQTATVDGLTGMTTLTFAYDESGRLSGVEGQVNDAPVHLTVSRESTGRPSGLSGAEGVASFVGLDDDGLLRFVARPDGTTLLLHSGFFGLLDGWLQDGSGETEFKYDELGRLAKATDPDGVVSTLSRPTQTADSLMVDLTAADGGVTEYLTERTGSSIRHQVVLPGGVTVTLETNTADGSATLTAPDRTVTTAGAEPNPLWGMSAPIRSPQVTTRSDGVTHRVEISKTAPADGSDGRVLQTQFVVDGDTTTISFDRATNTLSQVDAAGRSTERVFDSLGRMVELRRPGQPDLKYTFDDLGRLASATVGTGTGVAVTSYTYDTATGLVTIGYPDGTSDVVTYDAIGRQVQTTHADTTTVSTLRDAAGRVLQLRYGAHPSTTLGYSPGGRPQAYLPPVVGDDSSYETMTYDSSGRLASVSGPGERSIVYTYDSAGRPVGWQIGRGQISATYDSTSGLLSRLASPDGETVDFAHAGAAMSGATYSGPVSGNVGQVLDGWLRPSSESVNGSSALEFAYDASGGLVTIGPVTLTRDGATGWPTHASVSGATTANTYDENGRLASTTVTVAGQTVLQLAFERDLFGRVTKVTRTDDAGASSVSEYTYDDGGHLASATRDGATESYTYDAAGNRIADGSGTTAFDDRDRIQHTPNTSYLYQPDGTLASTTTSGQTTTYDFDDLGELTSVTLPDGRQIGYVVVGGGLRVGRIVNGTLVAGYLYRPDGLVAAQTDAAGNVVARFGYDGSRLVLVQRDGRDLLVTTDQLGSPVLLVDSATGEVAESIAYDAWGNVIADSNPGVTPIGFAGGLLDADTGLVHFQARDYDPKTGRWTSPDPTRFNAGDANLYRYVGTDPVNQVDPTGLGSCENTGLCGGWTVPPHSVLPPHKVGDTWVPNPYDPFTGSSGTGGSGGSGNGGSNGGGGTGGGNPSGGGGSKGGGGTGGGPGNGGGSSGGKGTGGGNGPGVGTCVGYCSGGANGPGGGTGGGNGGSGWCLGICSPPGGGICVGYCSWGEPHLKTGDGLNLDFQGAGEFTMMRSADGQLLVQARQEVPGSRTWATLTTAVAVKIDGDRLGFYSEPDRQLVVNGEVVDRTDISETLPSGAILERHGTEATVDWPDGTRLLVHLYGHFLNYTVVPPEAIAAGLVGVLGSRDGNVANDVAMSDGTVLDPTAPDFFDALHHEFADSWRITQAESLFDYLPGQTTDTFTNRAIPTKRFTIADLDPQVRADAEKACRAVGVTTEPTLTQCIFDIGVTGDLTYAGSAATVAASAVGASAGPTTPIPTDAQPIQIGTPVGGELSQPGEIDFYTFSLTSPGTVYLDAQGDCAGTGIGWELLSASGSAIKNDEGTAEAAICFDLKNYTLAAGDYAVKVFSQNDSTGPYAFAVTAVPGAQSFDIALGQPVSDGAPAAGAGNIEAPGAIDLYHFSLASDGPVYLDAQGDCGGTNIHWQLQDSDGTLIPRQDQETDAAICFDLGQYQLTAGSYTIRVAPLSDGVGTYAFEVTAVTAAQSFPISVGSQVSDGQPAAGAGKIESPAAVDDYPLTLAAQQQIYLDAQGDCGDTDLFWTLLGPDGQPITSAGGLADTAICFDLGAFDLAAGQYTIHVTDRSSGVGPYAFQVWAIPPTQTFNISVGATVSDGQPGPGAGTIDAPGAVDLYSFTLAGAQAVFLDALGDCGGTEIFWELLGPDGNPIANAAGTTDTAACFDLETYSLAAGTYQVRVSTRSSGVGPYSFQVRAP